MYIRFGEIPVDEISGIYKGDMGRIGSEPGVCCYDFVEKDGNYFIVMPMLKSASLNYDFESFVEDLEFGETKAYLIEGDLVGRATFREPCLKNVKVIRELELVDGFLKNKSE
jgi:hypothetical protein